MIETVAFVPNREVAGRVALQWGVRPVIEPESFDMEGMQHAVSRELVQRGIGKTGDPVVIVAGFPFGRPGSTNLVRVHTL